MESEAASARHPASLRWFWLPLLRVVLGAMFLLLGAYRVRRRDRVPRQGGLLILSNHLSDLDPIAVQLACPRPIHFMAKSELFEMKVIGPFVRFFRAFPVRRGEPDRSAIKHAVNLLRAGEVVCVFPEGELSETGELLPIKPGIALIARMAGVQAICIGLRRTNRMMPYGKVIPRPAFTQVSASWGEAKALGKDAEIEEIVTWVEAELARLTDARKPEPA